MSSLGEGGKPKETTVSEYGHGGGPLLKQSASFLMHQTNRTCK
jgi:hypothetical protein